MKFADIGQQLRAYRLESGLRAEEIAARLGVSRAALYRYEKGEVIKLDTVRRLAELLKISPLSLLGIGVEYFARPVAFLERLRQIEEQVEQIILFGGALCYQTSSDAFDGAVAEAWTEAADTLPDRFAARATAEQCLGLLGARRRTHGQRRPNVLAILSEASIQRFLAEGVAAGLAVPERVRARCRAVAQSEAENMAGLMESVPIGVQIGLAAGPDPVGQLHGAARARPGERHRHAVRARRGALRDQRRGQHHRRGRRHRRPPARGGGRVARRAEGRGRRGAGAGPGGGGAARRVEAARRSGARHATSRSATITSSSAAERRTAKPSRRTKSSIGALSASTCPTIVPTPWLLAQSKSRSMRKRPRPWPFISSATMMANSASSPPGSRIRRAAPRVSPVASRVAMKAISRS